MAFTYPGSQGDISGGENYNDYTPVTILDSERESTLQQVSQLQIYWRRFRTHRLALVGLGILVFLVLMAIFAPLITPGVTPQTYNVGNLGFGEHGPSLANFPALIFGSTDPTNDLERSVLSEITYGARISLLIGIVSSVVSSFIGIVMGATAGYFGGWVDNLLSRITDVFLTIPTLPLIVAISAIYAQGRGSPALIIGILAFVGWPGTMRLVRATFLSLREQEFTEAARSVGVRPFRIIFRHLLPNALSPVIVVTTLSVGANIVFEATLGFLQLGVQFPPTATWGNSLANSQDSIAAGNWWWPLFPGLFIALTVLAINFMGDGLRDALDVRSRVE